MRTSRTALRRLAGILLVMMLPGGTAAAEVIAYPGHPEDRIARPLLRGVFGMRVRAWPDGTPVRVFVFADHDPAHEDFARTVLQVYPYQLRQNWDRLLYSGTGQPPVAVGSEEEMLRRVAETPGAIGYLREYRPPANPKTRKLPAPPVVKVLHVQ